LTVVGGLRQVPLEQNTFRLWVPVVLVGITIDPVPTPLSTPVVRTPTGQRPVSESTLPTVAVIVPGWVGAAGAASTLIQIEALATGCQNRFTLSVTEVGLPTVRLPPLMVSTPSDPRALTVSEPVGVIAVAEIPAWARLIPVGASVSETGVPTQTANGGALRLRPARLGSANVVGIPGQVPPLQAMRTFCPAIAAFSASVPEPEVRLRPVLLVTV